MMIKAITRAIAYIQISTVSWSSCSLWSNGFSCNGPESNYISANAGVNVRLTITEKSNVCRMNFWFMSLWFATKLS